MNILICDDDKEIAAAIATYLQNEGYGIFLAHDGEQAISVLEGSEVHLIRDDAKAGWNGKLLWRVMENLLSNVFKYALKDSRVYIDVAPEIDAWRLEVKNISEYPLNVDPSELTERFIRGDSARNGEGSGLGLSIAQSFVQALGGRFALIIDGDLFKAIICLPKCKAL